jgi:hypothetical protein
MFYALLIICAVDAPTCDAEHAIFAEQSPLPFSSEEACRAGAFEHVREIWGRIPALRDGVEYQVVIDCEQAEPHAGVKPKRN